MRTEKEMMKAVLSFAENNDLIRGVYMNGSRANPKVSKDKYRDYDIVYVATETKWFIDNTEWIKELGEPAIIQEPDKNDVAFGESFDFSRSYGWLILFEDGNRIDLHIETLENICVTEDKLTVRLLDKDGIFPEIPEPTDEDYYVKRPSELQYKACCNNFWWCLNNVAKGIKRDQLSYVMWMYNSVVKDELNRMLDWYIGSNHDFKVTTGMAGKYYKKYLPEKLYLMFADTFSDYADLWKSIFTACDLFHIVSLEAAEKLGYAYVQSEEDAIRRYLIKMKNDEI